MQRCCALTFLSVFVGVHAVAAGVAKAGQLPLYDGVYVRLNDGTFRQLSPADVSIAKPHFVSDGRSIRVTNWGAPPPPPLLVFKLDLGENSGVRPIDIDAVYIKSFDLRVVRVGSIASIDVAFGDLLPRGVAQFNVDQELVWKEYAYGPTVCGFKAENLKTISASASERIIELNGIDLGTAQILEGNKCVSEFVSFGMYVETQRVGGTPQSIGPFFILQFDGPAQ